MPIVLCGILGVRTGDKESDQAIWQPVRDRFGNLIVKYGGYG